MAIGSALSVGLVGLGAFLVRLQAYVSPGLPYFSVIGLPDTSLSEARERVRSACQSAGFRWPETRVTVNLSPASLPKRGSSHDLAIAAAVMSATGFIPHGALAGTAVLGELNLDGTVLPVTGLLPAMLHARERGVSRMVVPHANLEEASLIGGIDVTGVRHVGEMVEAAGGQARSTCGVTEPFPPDLPAEETETGSGDMAEVIGQRAAKTALLTAAAGGHHVFMTGPPGSGKTMLASRMPGIMCPLTESEQLEVASVRSLCGVLPRYGITDVPPFEAPHHTASAAALAGGGPGLAQPGAITRAHRGVLFLDEAPEFSTRALQTLREPLESGYVTLSRSRGSTRYPAAFQLVMAANPCPCGYGVGTGERCVCSERERVRYLARLSGPILDRIDILTTVAPESRIPWGTGDGPTSAELRSRVVEARAAARERYAAQGWTCNAQASGDWLRRHTPRASLAPVNAALARHRLTMRGADRAV